MANRLDESISVLMGACADVLDAPADGFSIRQAEALGRSAIKITKLVHEMGRAAEQFLERRHCIAGRAERVTKTNDGEPCELATFEREQ